MNDRKYSVKEIDDLRRVCERRWLFGTTDRKMFENGGMSRGYDENSKSKAVEEMVRTHMMAGHVAEDILREDRHET